MVSHLYTISTNDVISSVRKHYCALGLGLGLAEYVFGQTCFRATVVEPLKILYFSKGPHSPFRSNGLVRGQEKQAKSKLIPITLLLFSRFLPRNTILLFRYTETGELPFMTYRNTTFKFLKTL